MTLRMLLRVVAWVLLAALVVVTLGPLGWRPVSHLPVQIERGVALAVIGFVFALAYPRHILIVAMLVLGLTVALEALQHLVVGRHGRVLDAVAKCVGAAIGLTCGRLARRIHRP